MQQFNHAIVYVPKQEGIETARFYDDRGCTDVASLRHDDRGTWSIVYDLCRGNTPGVRSPFSRQLST